jgi:hypothetical protein
MVFQGHKKLGAIVSLFSSKNQCELYNRQCGRALCLDDGTKNQGRIRKLHHTYWAYIAPKIPPVNIQYWIQTLDDDGVIEIIQSSVQPVLPAPVPIWYRVVPAENVGLGTGPAFEGQLVAISGITTDFYGLDASAISTLYTVASFTPANNNVIPATPNRWVLVPLTLRRFCPGDLIQALRYFGPTLNCEVDAGTRRVLKVENIFSATCSWYLTPTTKKYNVLYIPVRIAPCDWRRRCVDDCENQGSSACHKKDCNVKRVQLIVRPPKAPKPLVQHDQRLYEYLLRHKEHQALQWHDFSNASLTTSQRQMELSQRQGEMSQRQEEMIEQEEVDQDSYADGEEDVALDDDDSEFYVSDAYERVNNFYAQNSVFGRTPQQTKEMVRSFLNTPMFR